MQIERGKMEVRFQESLIKKKALFHIPQKKKKMTNRSPTGKIGFCSFFVIPDKRRDLTFYFQSKQLLIHVIIQPLRKIIACIYIESYLVVSICCVDEIIVIYNSRPRTCFKAIKGSIF